MTGHRVSVSNRYEIDEVELERLREAARVRAVSVHYGLDPHHGHLRHHGQHHGSKSNGRASGTTRVSQVSTVLDMICHIFSSVHEVHDELIRRAQ